MVVSVAPFFFFRRFVPWVMGFASSGSRTYLSYLHPFSWGEGSGHGDGWVAWLNACLLIGWLICLGPYFLPDQICRGCIHRIWAEPPGLFDGIFCQRGWWIRQDLTFLSGDGVDHLEAPFKLIQVAFRHRKSI